MAYDSGLHEPRTNAEQIETGDNLRVSFESGEWADLDADAAANRRLYYTEHPIQRLSGYSGPLERCSDEEARALLEEFLSFSSFCSPSRFPLPCTGLPGLLHCEYDRYEEAAELLTLGMRYVRAAIRNERKAMHNRWNDARQLIRKIEEKARLKAQTEIVEIDMKRMVEESTKAQVQLVYFIGSSSGPIKIGIAARPKDRLKTLQTGHHEKLELLATCEGGQALERQYHQTFAGRRLSGEWFELCPEIEAEIERLNRHG